MKMYILYYNLGFSAEVIWIKVIYGLRENQTRT